MQRPALTLTQLARQLDQLAAEHGDLPCFWQDETTSVGVEPIVGLDATACIIKSRKGVVHRFDRYTAGSDMKPTAHIIDILV